MNEQESLDFTLSRSAEVPWPPPDRPALLLTVNEAARMLGCGRTLIYELLGSGELEAVKIHRLRRIPADSLGSFVARLRSDQAA